MAEFTLAREAIKRGALAARSGCHIETIRYYEKIQLLPEPNRSAHGHRLYSKADQARLRFILRSRELGFSLEEIRSLLSLVDRGDYSCADIFNLTSEHVANIGKKIDDLKKLQKTLKKISKQCDKGNTPDCPIIDTLLGP